MKYIVEVLQPNEASGTRTQVYKNKDAAIDALDNYKYHRPGQPVVVLYNEDGEKKGLLAIGTGTDSYYILSGGDEIVNNYFTKIDASSVMVQPIDITELLSKTGPGYKFDTDPDTSYVPGSGLSATENRHFGWLGTSKADWAVTNDGNRWRTNLLTVQEMFDAILHGTKVNRSGEAPKIKIELLDPDTGKYTQNLVLVVEDIHAPKPSIGVRLTVENILKLDNNVAYDVYPDYSPFENEPDKYTLFKEGPYVYSTDSGWDYSYGAQTFTFSAHHEMYGDGFSQAVLNIVHEDPYHPTEKSVTTGIANQNEQTDEYYIAHLRGSSNWDTSDSVRGIRYKLLSETQWNEATLISDQSSTSTFWAAKTGHCEYNQDYEYYAYALNEDNEEITGAVNTFKYEKGGPSTVVITVKSGGHGSVSPDTYSNGITITKGELPGTVHFTATPYQGYRFKEWNVYGTSQTVSGNELHIVNGIQTDSIYTAIFEENVQPVTEYTISFITDHQGITFEPSSKILGEGTTGEAFLVDSNLRGTSASDYTISYWTAQGGTERLTVIPRVTGNATYVAHLVEKQPQVNIQYQHTYRGTDLGWNDVYSSIENLCTFTEINGQHYWLYSDYSPRPESGYDYFIPVSQSRNIETYINTNGKSFELYTWTGSEWTLTPISAAELTFEGNNIYKYTPTVNRQDIFAIKIS